MSTELAVGSANGETPVYRAITEDSTKKKKITGLSLDRAVTHEYRGK